MVRKNAQWVAEVPSIGMAQAGSRPTMAGAEPSIQGGPAEWIRLEGGPGQAGSGRRRRGGRPWNSGRFNDRAVDPELEELDPSAGDFEDVADAEPGRVGRAAGEPGPGPAREVNAEDPPAVEHEEGVLGVNRRVVDPDVGAGGSGR